VPPVKHSCTNSLATPRLPLILHQRQSLRLRLRLRLILHVLQATSAAAMYLCL
jgi:hypothetical protein